MAINGTQHSEGQKALLDLESRFTSKKTSVHGINGMQLKVLALFPRLFEDYPYPVVITAAILKLTDWFRQSNNVIKYHIYKVFKQSSEAHLPKVINTEEAVRRILPVLSSNDYVARSITLRMLGCMSMIIPEKLDVHHGVIQRLELAEDKPEIEATMWAADRFCAVSHRFLIVICSKIEALIKIPQVTPEAKTALIQMLRHMHIDIALTKKAMAICNNILNEKPRVGDGLLKVVLSTITTLTRHSLLPRTEHIDLLVSYTSIDNSQEIICNVLSDLVLLVDGQTKLTKANMLKLMNLGHQLLKTGSPLFKHIYTRTMLILLKRNKPVLSQIVNEQRQPDTQIGTDFTLAIYHILLEESNTLQGNLMLQCADILLTCSHERDYSVDRLSDEITADDIVQHTKDCLKKGIDSIIKSQYAEHKKTLLRKMYKVSDSFWNPEPGNYSKGFGILLDLLAIAHEQLIPVLCAKAYGMAHYSPIETSQLSSELLDIAKKRIDEPKAIVYIMKLALELHFHHRIHLDEPKPLLEEKCFSTIHLFGGWNSTEEKFTKNQAYLWDMAKIAGECQCFTLMHHILTGIAGDVHTEESDCWIQAMIKLSRSESILCIGVIDKQPQCQPTCELLDIAIEEQLWFQALMKTFATMRGPCLFQCWYIQLRTEMLTLIKFTLTIVMECKDTEKHMHDINAMYVRIERKIAACAKGWDKLASRYRFLERTINNADDRTRRMIHDFKLIALTFGYLLSSLKQRFNCIDPSIISLFDRASGYAGYGRLVHSAEGVSVQALYAMSTWSENGDMDLPTKFQDFSNTFEKYCFGILELSLRLPPNFFSNRKSVTVQMSVEPSLEEQQPLLLAADEDMLIKFEGIVQEIWQKGSSIKAIAAEIVCFSTSHQISTMGDQLQVAMIYDDPVQALKDLGETACLLHPPTIYRASIVNSYFSTMGLVHFPQTKQLPEGAGSRRQANGAWVNVLVRLIDDKDRVWITGPRYSRPVALQ